MMLSGAGYEVVGPVARIDQALEMATADDVDVVLLDIKLQGEDAYPVADLLVARGVPYAIMSGYSRKDLPPRFGEDTVMLRKPFRAETLLDTIKALLALGSGRPG